MKFVSISLLAAFGAVSALAQTPPGSPDVIVVKAEPTTSAATITLGSTPIVATWIFGPDGLIALQSPPFTFRRGTHLRVVAPTDEVADPVVTWYKDGQQLAEKTAMLEIASASVADSGGYTATVRERSGVTVKTFDTAEVVISQTGAPWANVSTRARLSAEQRTVVMGFVVPPGPSNAFLLVRAVGPALAAFGVADPLAAPRLRVLDSGGREVPTWPRGTVIIVDSSGNPVETTSSRAGEFPLPRGGKDVEHIYRLPPGAYTAEVSSADGGIGTVLVEMYPLPL